MAPQSSNVPQATTTTTAATAVPDQLILDEAGIPQAAHNLSFPPFPHLQASNKNITLIPFADFVPKGIHIRDEDDDATSPEVDAEGVPTIMLNVIHDLEKTSKKNKRSKIPAGSKTKEDGTPKTWFEQWADNEILMRAERLDPSQHSPYECLVQADIDFQHRRFFPLPVRALYDELRVFLGILDRIEKRKPWNGGRSRKPQQQQEEQPAAAATETVGGDADEEYVSDDDLDADADDDDMPRASNKSLPSAPPARTTVDDDDESDYGGPLAPLPEHSDLPSSIRFEQFLANPALAMKCFLSYEFRNRGLYWAEWNLYAGPIVVSAFLEFIIRHELLPASEYGQGLREAADVAKRAREELPATKKAARVLSPDGWGAVCSEIWGSREEVHWGASGLVDSVWTSSSVSDNDEGYLTELSSTDAPAPTLIMEDDVPVHITLNDAHGSGTTTPTTADISNKLSIDSLRTAVATPEHATTGTSSSVSGWGSSSSTDVPNAAETVAPLQQDFAASYGPSWDDPLAPAPSMFTYVGCASFPLTHSPVRAERSVREILAIRPPMDIFASKPSSPISLLHSKLATVVLGPWKGKVEVASEVEPPEMLRMQTPTQTSSTLNSESESSETREDPEYIAQFFRPGEMGESHDSQKDIITVFVDPEIVSQLSVGLGVGGIFVQAAKRLDAPTFPAIKDGNASTAPGKGKKGGKDQTPPYHPNDGRSWWYIDSVSQVIPSYWTDISELPAIENLSV